MTTKELSNLFDVYYNNITSNLAPGLDEYEKSVFLTTAQNDIIRSYFNSRQNKVQQGFDDSKKRLMDFSKLMKISTLNPADVLYKFDTRSIVYVVPEDLLLFVNELCIDSKYTYSVLPLSFGEYDRLMLKPYLYPAHKRGVWRLLVDNPFISNKASAELIGASGTISIVNSSFRKVTFKILPTTDTLTTDRQDYSTVKDVGYAPVIDITSSEVTITCKIYHTARTSDYWSYFLVDGSRFSVLEKIKEYVGDLNSLNSSFPAVIMSDTVTGVVIAEPALGTRTTIELIGRLDEPSTKYTIRYIRKPKPIILDDLEDDLSIDGYREESQCELDDSIHEEVLQRAVELAKAAYIGDLSTLMALGQASKTDIGIIAQSRQ